MAQTKEGALKARQSMLERYGEDYYKQLGAKGGSTPTKAKKGFAVDNRSFWQRLLRRPKRASYAGRKGGRISKRTKATV